MYAVSLTNVQYTLSMSKDASSFSERLTKAQRRGQRGDLAQEIYGKVPPQAIELEEAVLGAMMIEKNAITEVLDALRPESFYKDEHQEIYRAMLELFEASQPIDILTVTQKLRSMGKLEPVGGAYYIGELSNRVASSANLEYHARIISEKYILRELIRISNSIQKQAFDETTDVFNLLDHAEKDLFGVAEGTLRSSYQSMDVLISQAITQMEAVAAREEGLTGCPSGFTSLDRLTSGWQPSDLVVIAARPAMGKTSFVLSLARNASVDFKKPVAFFSLEMSSLQLVTRLISAETEIDQQKLRNGQLENHEWEQLRTRINKLSEAQVFIDDTAQLNVFELRAKCRRLKQQFDIQLIIVDYLQLMRSQQDNQKSTMNREQEISSISRALKGLAKELNVPVLALSQLSRAVETRGGLKKPILSDLRESGSIEQDADQVLFLYRPSYYGFTEDEEGRSTEGVSEVIIAKNRHGETADIRMKWINRFAKFDNLPENNDLWDDAQSFGTITRASRINDEPGGEEAPF